MRNPGGEKGVSAGKCNFSGRFHGFWQALGRGAKAAGLAGVEKEGRRGRTEAAPHRASDAPEMGLPDGAPQGACKGFAGAQKPTWFGPSGRRPCKRSHFTGGLSCTGLGSSISRRRVSAFAISKNSDCKRGRSLVISLAKLSKYLLPGALAKNKSYPAAKDSTFMMKSLNTSRDDSSFESIMAREPAEPPF